MRFPNLKEKEANMNEFENETGSAAHGIGIKRGCSRSPPSRICLVIIPEG